MGETISQGPRRIAADRSIQTIWVWLLYDDAEVAENQQNTGIDGVRLTAKRPDIKISQGLSFHEWPNELRDEGIRAENRFILQCPCTPSEITPQPLGRRPFAGSPFLPPPNNSIVHCFKHLGTDLLSIKRS
jgi:hypothetical protein